MCNNQRIVYTTERTGDKEAVQHTHDGEASLKVTPTIVNTQNEREMNMLVLLFAAPSR